jgi:hypothetical protein
MMMRKRYIQFLNITKTAQIFSGVFWYIQFLNPYLFAHWGRTSCDAFVAQSDKGADFGYRKKWSA